MGANYKYAYQKGKEWRLKAELNAKELSQPVPSTPPLFSHDATMQSYFNHGWKSVTAVEITRHLYQHNPNPNNPVEIRLRSFRLCSQP